MQRASGIFLHPTSLPSRFGIGDFGENAYRWIDCLAENKQRFWQVCPLGPTGYGDSPYQSLCSFAGNRLLIAPSLLRKLGLLTAEELSAFPPLPDAAVDYEKVIEEKDRIFAMAFRRFNDTKEFTEFCERERSWLDEFALFMVIKERQGGRSWAEWESPYKLRFPAALDGLRAEERRAVRYQKFLQFMFHVQWSDLRAYAAARGICVIGDMPYYVAYDSADTWASPELFELDEKGNPLRVAGVPPDYFSATGQRWGNPLYKWENMRQDGYAWWTRRIRKALETADVVRLDHFRGFESYWAVPAGSATAVDGTWEPGPGEDFFAAIKRALGAVPLIAEDLGEITHGVDLLRRKAGFPGMKVLQFAFDGDPENPYLPCNVTSDSIMYTGTHDNDTALGWYAGLAEKERSRVSRYLGCDDETFIDRFLRLAYMSASRLCLIPAQDILGLGQGSRMNTPGTGSGNWRWRLLPDRLQPRAFAAAGEYAEIYGRDGGAGAAAE
jgi:4-alpha-glucanotransferase